MEFELKPSPAAVLLLASLSLPKGAASVWPSTKNGVTRLIVQLDHRYLDRSKLFPKQFQTYEVIVEPKQNVRAQTMITAG
jgi:hypothetical protein